MIADYLQAGSLIEERIRLAGTAIKRVSPLGNLYSLLENEPDKMAAHISGQLPAAFVGFDGESPGDVAGDGFTHLVAQRWLVVLAVGNYRNADTAQGVTADAGPLLTALVKALTGWAPSADFTKLMRQAAPRPGYLAGVGFFPLVFATTLVVEGLTEGV
jgi:hypothetical protein